MLSQPSLRTVEELFKSSFFKIPGYQREYVWEPEDIENLIKDVKDAQKSKIDYYFIGNLVTFTSDGHETCELVDGQQRLSTIFMILAALRALLNQKNIESHREDRSIQIEQLEKLLQNREEVSPGKYQNKLRVEPQYSNSRAVLSAIVQDKSPAINWLEDSAASRLWKSYTKIKKLLETEFSEKQLTEYSFFLRRHVKLIEIPTDSKAEANLIFSRLNSRGTSLDPPDLVKNHVLERANESQFDDLSEKWKEISRTLDAGSETYTRFLRYYIITIRGDTFKETKASSFRENDVLQWFEVNKSQYEDPGKFLDNLEAAASRHVGLLLGKDFQGKEVPSLLSIARMSKRLRQHLFALLPLHEVKEEQHQTILVKEIADMAEASLYISLVTDENSTRNETRFIGCSIDIQAKKADFHAIRKYAREELWKDVQGRRNGLTLALREFSKGSPSTDVRRFTLAKICAYLASQHQEGALTLVSHYWTKTFSEEHILARDASVEALAEFGPLPEDYDIRYRLGNLTLVENLINKSLGNGPYSGKLPKYALSTLMMVRALVANDSEYETGLSGKGKDAWAMLEKFSTWDQEAVLAREENLIQILLKAYGLAQDS